MKKKDNTGLYIKYVLSKKIKKDNYEEINSSIFYHEEFIDSNFNKTIEQLNNFLQGNMKGEMGFERKINLDDRMDIIYRKIHLKLKENFILMKVHIN